ncbi:MAG: EamA family transporter [Lachnospiraceae bacterium]|nr:EamA family transporter [Lachnospiraceae bacterium]
MWMWLVLLYGVLKGFREIVKKKALEKNSTIEVLFMYTLLAFLLVAADAQNALGMEPKYYFYIAVKSFVIFLAWMFSFKAIKKMPISLYGVLDLSRVLFATLLGVVVLQETLGALQVTGLAFVSLGLVLLKYKPGHRLRAGVVGLAGKAGEVSEPQKGNAEEYVKKEESTQKKESTQKEHKVKAEEGLRQKKELEAEKGLGQEKELEAEKGLGQEKEPETEERVDVKLVVMAFASCLLNAVSGLLDKLLMRDISSSQLQFWYMLFLVLMYLIFILVTRTPVHMGSVVRNQWIWILSILFVIADRALFAANGMAESRITVMTLIKQSGCIVTILAGRFLFHEKNTGHKLVCAAIIIAGIVLGVM